MPRFHKLIHMSYSRFQVAFEQFGHVIARTRELLPFNQAPFTNATTVHYLPSKFVRQCQGHTEVVITQYDSTVIVLYSRDHKGEGMAHEKTSPKKPASIFHDNDEAVLVR